MWRLLVAVLVLFAYPLSLPGGTACSAGMPLLTFQLAVEPADASSVPISVRSVNDLTPDLKLIYAPISFSARDENKGRVSLVLVPADPNQELQVLKPRPAEAAAEWEIPFRTSVVALVYGPKGLDTGKVSSLVKKDHELVEQLAEYAEQTTKTEKLLEALEAWDNSPTAADNLQAAVAGFSASYGRPAPQLRRDAPMEQQMATLMKALNPALSTYDPLAPQSTQRLAQSATLASSVAGLFFGGPVGLAAGGAAMFVNLSGMMFPNTQFRSAFVQEAPSHSLTLCADRRPHKSRTRQAYFWAVKIPNASAPRLEIPRAIHVPLNAESPVPVKLAGKAVWPSMSRVRDWRLVPAGGGEAVPVSVAPDPTEPMLRMMPKGPAAMPGLYRLAGTWDWESFEADGEVHVHAIDPAVTPQIAAGSRDALVTGAGPVKVVVQGGDFEFVDRVELRQGDGAEKVVAELPFELPKGRYAGPQEEIEVTVDAGKLAPGAYTMAFLLADSTEWTTAVRILPPNPSLEGLPVRVNLGETRQEIQFEGSGIDRIRGVRCDQAEIAWNSSGIATVQLAAAAVRGDLLDIELEVEGRTAPLRVPGALEVAGPRPRVRQARLSLPENLGVQIRREELPAGSFASFSLEIGPLESAPGLALSCAGENGRAPREVVRPGDQSPALRFSAANGGQFFLSLDPGAFGQPGCALTMTVETETQGRSDPFPLGRVVQLPQISRFELTDEANGSGHYTAYLEGEDLEMIERVGWDSYSGVPVNDLPIPVADGGHQQRLKIAVPWPSPKPHAPLYIWLRGEQTGRATTARY